jgi:hypothetical protein
MPPKIRTLAERRRSEQSERAKRERISNDGVRRTRTEAYDRNKRAAEKVAVRRWQDWT